MENKNNVVWVGIGGIIVGLVIGTFCFGGWGRDMRGSDRYEGKHMMEDGTMMGDSMNDMMHGMMSGLEGKTGDAFDKAFIEEMIVHHQGAVDMANAVLANSKRPELIKLANEIISAQTKEIEMMEVWEEAWFN